MKVVLTETLDLEVHKTPYEVRFAFNRKRGVTGDHWFTPSGKCKIWIGGCHTQHLGKLTQKDYDTLMEKMKKSDILTDGYDYYTTGNVEILKLGNMRTILYQINEEWEARKYEWIDD